MQLREMKPVTMTGEGEITLSSDIIKKLGLAPGATFVEMLLGNCVILVPKDGVVSGIADCAEEVLDDASALPAELLAVLEKIKDGLLQKKNILHSLESCL